MKYLYEYAKFQVGSAFRNELYSNISQPRETRWSCNNKTDWIFRDQSCAETYTVQKIKLSALTFLAPTAR